MEKKKKIASHLKSFSHEKSNKDGWLDAMKINPIAFKLTETMSPAMLFHKPRTIFNEQDRINLVIQILILLDIKYKLLKRALLCDTMHSKTGHTSFSIISRTTKAVSEDSRRYQQVHPRCLESFKCVPFTFHS